MPSTQLIIDFGFDLGKREGRKRLLTGGTRNIRLELGLAIKEKEEERQMEQKTGKQEKDKIGKLCKRCKGMFTPSSNSSSSCRFHPSFFVCRRHDDQKRYYELGPDDPPYAAKFYDCCGAEDPEAPGCTVAPHISYDDE